MRHLFILLVLMWRDLVNKVKESKKAIVEISAIIFIILVMLGSGLAVYTLNVKYVVYMVYTPIFLLFIMFLFILLKSIYISTKSYFTEKLKIIKTITKEGK